MEINTRAETTPPEATSILVMRSMAEYPPGLIGMISALFGRTIAGSHGVDWTLDAMIAEKQCEFFSRFDRDRDRVWIAMKDGWPHGALTIEGPRPEAGRDAARLRFFILDETLRGRGIGKAMLAAAMQFCREQHYRRVFSTTLPGLDAAMRLYEVHGFEEVSRGGKAFHGSEFAEVTMECKIG
jgi:GNAT superfamily N-acetyltransferase